MLYNQEVKQQYFDSLMSIDISEKSALYISQIQSLFNTMSQEEQRMGKDIGEFTKDEIIDALTHNRKRSARTLYTYGTRISKYCSWYQKEILKNDRSLELIFTLKEMQQIILERKENNEGYGSLLYSKDLVDHIIDLQINPVQKLILSAVYFGISGNHNVQLTSMHMSNLIEGNQLKLYDWKNNALQIERTIKISDQILYYLVESSNTYSFKVPNPQDSTKINSEFKLSGPYAIKGTADEDSIEENIDLAWVHRRNQVIFNRMEKIIVPPGMKERISLKKLYVSGFVNTLKAQAQILGIPVRDIFSTQYIDMIALQYGKQNQKTDQIKFWLKEYL